MIIHASNKDNKSNCKIMKTGIDTYVYGCYLIGCELEICDYYIDMQFWVGKRS